MNSKIVETNSQMLPVCRFIPDPEKDHVNENRGQTSKMEGEDALKFGMRLLMGITMPSIVEICFCRQSLVPLPSEPQ